MPMGYGRGDGISGRSSRQRCRWTARVSPRRSPMTTWTVPCANTPCRRQRATPKPTPRGGTRRVGSDPSRRFAQAAPSMRRMDSWPYVREARRPTRVPVPAKRASSEDAQETGVRRRRSLVRASASRGVLFRIGRWPRRRDHSRVAAPVPARTRNPHRESRSSHRRSPQTNPEVRRQPGHSTMVVLRPEHVGVDRDAGARLTGRIHDPHPSRDSRPKHQGRARSPSRLHHDCLVPWKGDRDAVVILS